MILPSTSVAAGQATTTTLSSYVSTHSPTNTPGHGHYPENWSSLIGIITAIVGNILISFALNIQRYAHIRLEKEWQEKEKSRKRRGASRNASQAKLAAKYQAPQRNDITFNEEQEALDEDVVATESDPLLGGQSNARLRSRPTLVSNGSSSESNGEEEEEEAYKQKSYLKSPWWWAGIILMTTGEAGNFLAYGFAPASIVSPLGVVALVSNCIIAPMILKERFRFRDGLGVLVAVAGAVTVVASAKSDNPKLGPHEIWKMITRWEFEAYLGITIAVIIALTFASNEYGHKSILIDLGLVGLYGGYTALSTKGVASMLSYTLWRAITFPVTYLLVAILVFTAVMQIKYVNRALQRFDATQVIPVQFVMFTLSVILGSAILYRDFERTSGKGAGEFVGGCFLTFSGVWLITNGRHQSRNEDDEDRDPEPEESINLVNGDRYHDDFDGAVDGEESSRRSSTIRAASPPIDIGRRGQNQDTSTPSTPQTRQSLTQHLSYEQTPPTPSVLPDAPSSVTSNPWQQDPRPGTTDSSLIRPPSAPIARHSTPILPSEATATPPASRSNPELAAAPTPPPPHTPTRGTSDNIVQTTPSTLPPRLRRIGTSERLGSRNSIPGPILASPLSTSLSAMVADLKRGGSVRSTRTATDLEASVRRRESVLGIGASEVDEEQIGEPLDRRRTATDDVPSQARTRKLSLSGTLGDLWRGIKGRTGEEDIDR